MSELRELRENWDAVHGMEQNLFQEMTIQESLQQLYRLQVAFEWLEQFEQALDDSTLVMEYKRLRCR